MSNGVPPEADAPRPSRPDIYDCGCSRHKVDAGLCDVYGPGGVAPLPPDEVGTWWLTPPGPARNAWIAHVPSPKGAMVPRMHGPMTPEAALALVRAVRAAELADGHVRDCRGRPPYVCAWVGSVVIRCPDGLRLDEDARRARSEALSYLGAYA